MLQLLLRFTHKEHAKEWQELADRFMRGGLFISGQGSGTAQTEEEMLHSFKLLCCHPVSSHLMEVLLTHCSSKHFSKTIFPNFLRGNFLELSRHKVANYVIQAAVQALSTDTQLDLVLEELSPGIATSLLNNNLGVIWRLAEKCSSNTSNSNKAKDHQRILIRSLVKGLRARRQSSSSSAGVGIIDCLLDIKPTSREASGSKREPVPEIEPVSEKEPVPIASTEGAERSKLSPLGALITECVLGFHIEQSRVLLESLASMDPDDLVTICTDPIGGRRIIEPLMRAGPSFRWAQHRVLSKLLPKIVSLCENKYSAPSVKLAFAVGSLGDRTLIVKKLGGAKTRLAGSRSGASVLVHCKVQLFKEQPSQWQELQRRDKKKRKRAGVDAFLKDVEAAPKRASLEDPAAFQVVEKKKEQRVRDGEGAEKVRKRAKQKKMKKKKKLKKAVTKKEAIA